VIIACMDMNVCPVQSHVSPELPHVARSHPQPTRVVSVPSLPTPCICPFTLQVYHFYQKTSIITAYYGSHNVTLLVPLHSTLLFGKIQSSEQKKYTVSGGKRVTECVLL
jgi:hypothetical protein